MKVREFNQLDFKAVCEINKECHEFPSPEHLLLKEIRGGKCWVATKDYKVIGFLVAKIKDRLPYIYNVAVSSDYRNIGVGSWLIEAFEQAYPKKRVWLQVDNNNPARSLYLKLGYKIESVVVDFYSKGKHAVCMYKLT